MLNEQQFTENITIGGALQDGEAEQLRERGFATVINLTTPGEPGYEEGDMVKDAGLDYVSVPIAPDSLDDIKAAQIIQEIGSSDGPVYLHCKGGGRAGIFALLSEAISHGWSVEETMLKGQQMNVKLDENSPYRAFIEDYIIRHSAGERQG